MTAGDGRLEPSLLLGAAAADRRPRLQDRGGPVPHVDAGRLRRRADPGDRLHVGRPKAAGFAAIDPDPGPGARPAARRLALLIAVLALLTMAFGNIVAIAQRNIKRMLAYSSIAHTGYMLVGLAAYEATGAGFGSGAGRRVGDQRRLRAALLHARLHLHEHRRVRGRGLAPAPWPRA